MKDVATHEVCLRISAVVLVGLAGVLGILASGTIPPAPGGPSARPLAGGCVLHVDGWTLDNIHLNVKTFSATRDKTASLPTFGSFSRVAGPTGSIAVPAVNTDGIPSVYAVTEAWFRGSGFNETFRAQVIPAMRGTDPTDPGSSAALAYHNQDFTGLWTAIPHTNLYFAGALVGPTDPYNADPLPQWLHVGVASPRMFACGGAPTQNGAQGTTWLMEFISKGTTPGAAAAITRIQDVLNGDRYFTAPAPGSNPLGPVPVASPAPGIGAPAGNGPTQGVVSCSMTQTGDDATSRVLHAVSAQNRQLQYATLSNFGPVFVPMSDGNTSSFSRFRANSAWVDVLQNFPNTDFGEIVHVATVASGVDQVLHVFFVGRRNENGQTIYRLWHTRRLGPNAGWNVPVDVLSSSGESSNGTVYDLPISGAFCPANDDTFWSRPGEEILLAWYEPLTRTILVIGIERNPKVWIPGLPSSIYSPYRVVAHTGMATSTTSGGTLTFTPLRVRISSRPFSDTPGPP